MQAVLLLLAMVKVVQLLIMTLMMAAPVTVAL